MKLKTPVAVQWIAGFIKAELIGNTEGSVTGINEIHNVNEGDLVFVDHPKYYDTCLNSAASFIIINKAVECPPGKALLIVEQPFEAYISLVNHFAPFTPSHQPISDTAIIGEGTVIMPGCFIGHDVRIGKRCILHPNVVVYDGCVIGDDVEIHSGTVIGSDAFYYNGKKNREVWYKKMLSCGNVRIEDEVEIGSNCSIDRGVSSTTIIGKGTKMDNLIHIGHDTTIGENCLIAAAVIIAGCVVIENGVTIWGHVVINKTLTIGENAVLLARTGVSGNLEGNKTYWGAPAQEARSAQKELVWIKRIPELWEKVMKG